MTALADLFGARSPEDLILAVCLSVVGLSAGLLLLMTRPTSWLSKRIDEAVTLPRAREDRPVTAPRSNAELAREYVDAAMASPDEQHHPLVRRHGAPLVLQAANTLAVLATAEAIRGGGPTSLRDCIEALAPQLRPAKAPWLAYKVGDPDPTPSDGPWCGVEGPSGDNDCTWHRGHVGQPHVAGDDETILEVWW